MNKHVWLPLALLIALTFGPARAAKPILMLHIDGQIDPTVAAYIAAGIDRSTSSGAQAVLILMDTPGGSMDSTQKIVRSFLASKTPIIVFVHPNGATAASAGVFITVAADIAAMAPVSNIGSASPISMGPSGEVQKLDETLKRKITNFAAEWGRSIAQKRGRNAEWVVRAVTQADNITSARALKIGVIDYISPSVPDLMAQMDGKTVSPGGGGKVVLQTRSAPIEDVPMGTWETFLHCLSNPMIAMFLSLAAMYGIIYELASPGAVLPGIVGGISVILLLYSFSVIPVSGAGLALLVLGLLLFLAEAHMPGATLPAVGGTISLFMAFMMLFRSHEGFEAPMWSILLTTAALALFLFFVAGMALKALKRPYVSSREGVVGHTGEAKTDLDPSGRILVDGALWTATAEGDALTKGTQVVVTAMRGLKLRVKAAEEETTDRKT